MIHNGRSNALPYMYLINSEIDCIFYTTFISGIPCTHEDRDLFTDSCSCANMLHLYLAYIEHVPTPFNAFQYGSYHLFRLFMYVQMLCLRKSFSSEYNCLSNIILFKRKQSPCWNYCKLNHQINFMIILLCLFLDLNVVIL